MNNLHNQENLFLPKKMFNHFHAKNNTNLFQITSSALNGLYE